MVGNQEFPDIATAHLFSQLCPESISIAKHSQPCPSREGARMCYLNEHTFPSFGEFFTTLRILDVGKFVPPQKQNPDGGSFPTHRIGDALPSSPGEGKVGMGAGPQHSTELYPAT